MSGHVVGYDRRWLGERGGTFLRVSLSEVARGMNQSGVIDSRLLQCDHSACTVSESSPGWHSTLSALRSEI